MIWAVDEYILMGAVRILGFIALFVVLILVATLLGGPFFIFVAMRKKGDGGSAGEADSKE